MPGCRCAAIASVAEAMKVMSGSPVLLSGVGTQIETPSHVASTEKSEVAEKLESAASAAEGMSSM